MKTLMKILTISIVSLAMVGCGEQAEIVERNGFMVLDIEQEQGQETIVAKIVDMNKDHLENGALAINLYDHDDMVNLNKEQIKGLRNGDVILITFEGVDIVDVRINRLNIGNYIKGQVVTDELLNGGSWN